MFNWPRGPMNKASAYGAGDCRFESCRGHCIWRAQYDVQSGIVRRIRMQNHTLLTFVPLNPLAPRAPQTQNTYNQRRLRSKRVLRRDTSSLTKDVNQFGFNDGMGGLIAQLVRAYG